MKPPRQLVAYRPKPGLPLDAEGRLLLDYEYAPLVQTTPPAVVAATVLPAPRKVARGLTPKQGDLL